MTSTAATARLALEMLRASRARDAKLVEALIHGEAARVARQAPVKPNAQQRDLFE